jgi:hypothetical protein
MKCFRLTKSAFDFLCECNLLNRKSLGYTDDYDKIYSNENDLEHIGFYVTESYLVKQFLNHPIFFKLQGVGNFYSYIKIQAINISTDASNKFLSVINLYFNQGQDNKITILLSTTENINTITGNFSQETSSTIKKIDLEIESLRVID